MAPKLLVTRHPSLQRQILARTFVALALNAVVAAAMLRLSEAPWFVLTGVMVCTALVVLGLLQPRVAVWAFRVAAGLQIAFGILGLFSVGLPLLLAGVLLLGAADRAKQRSKEGVGHSPPVTQ